MDWSYEPHASHPACFACYPPSGTGNCGSPAVAAEEVKAEIVTTGPLALTV